MSDKINLVNQKKTIQQIILKFKEDTFDNFHFNVMMDQYKELEIIEDQICDPRLNFSNNILDDEYYEEHFPGFSEDGWDCIDILVNSTDNELIKSKLNIL
tara:strand:- start:210 stop:509 length:300 start_codon:yes stop_codon:yes gene_type:complete